MVLRLLRIPVLLSLDPLRLAGHGGIGRGRSVLPGLESLWRGVTGSEAQRWSLQLNRHRTR